MGVRRNLPEGDEVDILLIFFRLLVMQRKWIYTKMKMSNVTFPCKKTLHWANVYFSEHGYFMTELAEF